MYRNIHVHVHVLKPINHNTCLEFDLIKNCVFLISLKNRLLCFQLQVNMFPTGLLVCILHLIGVVSSDVIDGEFFRPIEQFAI